MITEIDKAIAQSSSECNLTLMKTSAIMEAALREHEINKEAAELKVIKESGTDSDLEYYYEAADNGLVQTIIKIIKQIKEAIIKFCSDVKSRVLTIIGKKENVETLDKIEKKVKYIPLLKRKKILAEDYNAEAKCSEKAFSELNRLKVKAKAGQSVTVDDVNEVKESFFSQHKALVGVGAAITITVGAALTALKTMGNKSANITNDLQKRATDACDECIKMAEKIDNPKVAESLSSAIVEVSKTAQEDYVRSYNGMLKQIKGAVKSIGKTEVDVDKAKRALNLESTGAMDVDEVIDDDKVKEISSSAAKDVSEMGDDPESDIPPQVDDEPDTDPWDDVMNTDVDLDQDEEDMLNNQMVASNNLGESGDESEEPDNIDDSSDDMAEESTISELFDDILGEVYESNNPMSEYDVLMSEIENLV